MQMVAERTRQFATVARNVDAILAFKESEEARLSAHLHYTDFYHCPFIGLIGPERATVGCMLHPLAANNRAIDYRSLSHYGALACGVYFCPATRQLPPVLKTILKEGAKNWYTYGLLVTEYRLVTTLFEQLACRNGIHLADLEKCSAYQAKAVVSIVETLKLAWPYRSNNGGALCHYLFDDGLYTRPAVTYPGRKPSPACKQIFMELSTVFDTMADQAAAENLINHTIAKLAESVREP
jgi:hypothetical protein